MMKAIKIERPGKVVLIDMDLPKPKPDEILIMVKASGICGTDIHIFRGDYLGEYPVIPGHEFSGIVESVGEKVTRFTIGDRVAVEPNISCDTCFNCLNNRQNFCENWEAVGVTKQGGMAQYVAVPEKSVFSIGKLPFKYGALMEPLSCVLHGLENVKVEPADRVVILGAGPIGLLFIQLVRLHGVSHITVLEKRDSRIKLAEQLGADQILKDVVKIEKDKFDVVIDATGVISLMEKTVELVRLGGKILWFGVPPNGVNIKIEGSKIFKKGVTIMTSYTSLRNSFQAVELLMRYKINVSGMISHFLPLSEFEKGVELIERGTENVNKVIILPQE